MHHEDSQYQYRINNSNISINKKDRITGIKIQQNPLLHTQPQLPQEREGLQQRSHPHGNYIMYTLYIYTVTPLLGEPPICNTLSSTTLFSMTDWFSLYKTYKLTSNEQHLSNPTCNTQTVNKHSQHPLLSNTFPGFPVAPFQHHSM